MAIEDLNSKAELFRAVRENLESEPLPTSAVDGLQESLQGGNWTAPTLAGGWSIHGEGQSPPGYRAEAGTIRLRGLLTIGGGAAGATILTLPPGARPKETLVFVVASSAGAAQVNVGPNGDVVYAGTTEAFEYFSLSGITFVVGS